MKHIENDGKLINVEKKWSHLKMKQKEMIFLKFRNAYIRFLNNEGRHPDKLECGVIVDEVYNFIRRKGIVIPHGDVKKAFDGKLNKYRKMSLDIRA